MHPEEFRRHGHELVDWVADYLGEVMRQPPGGLPARPPARPGDVRAKLPAAPPERGEEFAAMLRDVDEVVVPGIVNWQSPNFYGYFQCNNSGPSVLGELLSAGLGVQGMLWATSPAATELETHVMDWLVDLLGLPESFRSSSTGGGVIQDTASSATLVALLAARERATNWRTNTTGVDRKLTVYASSQAHSSVEKAVRIAGLGSEQLRLVEVDETYALRPEALAARIAADRAAGHTPCLAVATVGTTSSHALDPVRATGEVCRRENVWLHVDAAHAGTAAICPEFRGILDGLELADSFCFNPHKWMFVNFDCDAFYVADRSALIRTLSVLPEYLRNQASASGAVIDYRDWQIPLGRRFRALKLWFTIRHYGAEGLRHHVREHVTLAQELAERIESHDELELAAPVPLNLVCFRHKGGEAETQRMLDELNATGEVLLTHTRLDDHLVVRVSVGTAATTKRTVDRLWELIGDAAEVG
jgi:aromatic-L-amino-acid decarboxylase